MKTTYKVTVNWYGELHSFYTTTTSQVCALVNTANKLGKKLGVSGKVIYNHISQGNKATIQPQG
jgi:hypothetical protein